MCCGGRGERGVPGITIEVIGQPHCESRQRRRGGDFDGPAVTVHAHRHHPRRIITDGGVQQGLQRDAVPGPGQDALVQQGQPVFGGLQFRPDVDGRQGASAALVVGHVGRAGHGNEGGQVGLAENSWAKQGGVDDRCEIYGSGGFTRADLLRGSALLTYSEPGYGYAVEKAATTKGYTFTMFEEIWNYGFPQELQHFARCVQGKETPIETGEDGREVLKIIYAAYESAGTGRRIDWPYTPRKVTKPIDLWRK